MDYQVLKIVRVVLFVIIVVFSAVVINTVFFPRQAIIVPHIVPDSTSPQSAPEIISHQFPFENTTVHLKIIVNTTIYTGAKQSEKATTVYGNVSEAIWIAESYRSMIQDPAQDGLYDALIAETEKVRLRQKLSDDEYLELLTVYVQSLKYQTREENPVKFPIETVVDRAGDCDDKSLLLAGLLSRQGYPVVLLRFGPESHMAVGVGSDNYLYKETGYAFVETTNYSFVGVPTARLGGNLTLYSDPLLIPVSNGTKLYRSGSTTRYIQDMYESSDRQAKEIQPQIKSMAADLTIQQEKIARLETRMQDLKTSGNTGSYNAQVPLHNALVSDYNAMLDTYRKLFARYEKYVLVHNYILEHMYDRTGVFEYTHENMPV